MTTPLDRVPASILDRFLAGESVISIAVDYDQTRFEVERVLRAAIRERLGEGEE